MAMLYLVSLDYIKIILLFFCQDITGNHVDNCVPLNRWLNSGVDSVTLKLNANQSDAVYHVDLVTTCMAASDVMSYTWPNRRNLYDTNDTCYNCDYRSD